MGRRLKWMFCALLAAAALLCLVATMADIGVLQTMARGREEYMLRQSGGYVCVYRLPNTRTPLFVTDISAQSLPAAKRAELAMGIGAADYGEMRTMLDNLGS